MSLFVRKDFTSHSGLSLDWKIDCDALTDEDLAAVAWVVSQRVEFGDVIGVPRGGLRIAEALRPHATRGPLLIVDDVLTTGRSMQEMQKRLVGEGYSLFLGFVLFARGPCPRWVDYFFNLNTNFST